MPNLRIAYSIAACFCWLLASVAATVVHSSLGPSRFNAWPESPPFFVYSAVLFLPLAAFFIWGPPFRAVMDFPRPHRAVLLLMVAAITAGHLANASRYTFPFMDWQMFTRSYEPEEIVYHDFVGIRADATHVQINPVRLLPPLDQCRLYVGFTRFGEVARQLDSPRAWRIYDDMIMTLAKRYNKTHPDAPVVEIEVQRNALRVDSGEEIRELLRSTNFGVRPDDASSP